MEGMAHVAHHDVCLAVRRPAGRGQLDRCQETNARDLIDKLVPYQGAIGVVLLLWGLLDLVRLLQLLSI